MSWPVRAVSDDDRAAYAEAPARPALPMSAEPYAKPLKFRWFDLLLEDRTMKDTKLRLAMMLYSYADAEGHKIRVARDTLAERLGVTVRTLHRLIPELEEEGWLVCVAKGNNLGRQGKASEYHLSIPRRFFNLGPV